MGYKTILTILQSEADAERVLDFTVPLAQHFESHLIGVHAEPLPVPFASPMGFPDSEFLSATLELNTERTKAIRKIFEAKIAAFDDVSGEWREMENLSGDSALSGMQAARTADLVVAQQSDPDARTADVTNVEALLFETGRPVLFVPYAAYPQPPFRKILVAWNGKKESARAAFDALPFILEAEVTEVFTVDAPEDETQSPVHAGAELAAALARHGANVTIGGTRSGDLTAGQAIENRVAETGVNLLVMGAYSHSRLREFFFGGVTRTLLDSMTVPTLMSR